MKYFTGTAEKVLHQDNKLIIIILTAFDYNQSDLSLENQEKLSLGSIFKKCPAEKS